MSPLIGLSKLADLLASGEPPVLLDVRWRLGAPPGIESYLAGAGTTRTRITAGPGHA